MKKKKESEKKSNSIGVKENNENRELALKTLDLLTKKREKDGFVWVIKGKTSKQIHPDKLQDHIADNWKLSKVKK